MAPLRRTRVLQLSLGAILSAFLVELVLGVASNSLALVTDSIHALLDAVVTVVLLVAARMAAKPPDADHTYGHGKIESLGGLLGGIAILLLACFFIYESASRFQDPQPAMIAGTLAMIGVLYTVGVDVFRIVLLRRAARDIGGQTLRADLYHAAMDLGSTGVAIAGIALASWGIYSGDFAAALVLGLLLAALSVKLVYRSALDLTDVISPELVREVRGIARGTGGVIDANPVMVRKSGDVVFVDITVSLAGDTSFERAHEISGDVEKNIKRKVPGAAATVHFEPDWKGVPLDSRVQDVAQRVGGVKGVHNVSTHRAKGTVFADLHVMVDRGMSLESAHAISEQVEAGIQKEIPEIKHATVHLEPFVTIPEESDLEDRGARDAIRAILERDPDIRGVGRIVSLRFGGVLKIDIDCSFDGNLTIERVHDKTSEIERAIKASIRDALVTIHPEPA